jgi:hypothetical protein
MRRLLVFILVLLALSAAACRAAGGLPVIGNEPAELPQATLAQATPSPTEIRPTHTAYPPATPTPVPPPTVTPEPQFTTTATPEWDFRVRYHPDHALYEGDLVSFEVIAPQGKDVAGQSVRVEINGQAGESLGPVEFHPFGIERRMQATFSWAWDTSALDPGGYTLTYSIEPEGYQWQESLVLHPASALPSPEPEAEWASAENECCSVHYITGTEAERDLESLLEQIDATARQAASQMGTGLGDRMDVTLLPRVLGHGGFAGDGISVSYLDRNYAGSSFEMVLHHEMVHIFDSRLGGELRPTILVEGLAVYLTGGHFKPEAMLSRAAALLELSGGELEKEMGWYKPLIPLTDNFYPSQHEIGYLQGAALVKFMVQTWGWEAFSVFYRDIQPHSSGSQSGAIDAALQAHFDMSFSELEQKFLEELKRQEVRPEHIQDVRLTVDFYDSVRRYQQHLDPSAYFMTAWLPDRGEMQARGVVADFVRRPVEPANIILEEMLVDAHRHLMEERFEAAELVLGNLHAELDAQVYEPMPAYEETY